MIQTASSRPIIQSSLILALVVIAGCTGSALRPPSGAYEPTIRVCIADRTGEVVLGLGDEATIRSVGKQFVIKGPTQLRCTLSEGGGILIQPEDEPALEISGAFRCYFRKPGATFRFEKREYGDTLLIATDGEHLYLINALPLETYLGSVVPNETGKNRTDEEIAAVRAQAIIARTYAINKIRLPLTRLFDVYDDVRDQVFGGVRGGDPISTEAVQDTRGIVVAFDGHPAECYFHSTCGGSTEASINVWHRPQSKPWLIGVTDRHVKSSFCGISPSYRWTEVYTRTQFEGVLRNFLPSANDALRTSDVPAENWHLLDLNLLKRAPSGRVQTVQIVMGNRSHQRSYYVHADKIRWALRRLDGSPLRSTLFDVHLKRDAQRWITQVRIDGGGNGHGVGLCQWGAIARARAGESHTHILETYFPGTELMAVY